MKNTRLWLRRLDAQTARPLPGTESAILPFWSPDSRFVGFSSGNALKKIDIGGGPPVVIVENVGAFRGGSWNRDGVVLFGLNDGGQEDGKSLSRRSLSLAQRSKSRPAGP